MRPNNLFITSARYCFILLLLFCLNCGKDSTTVVPPSTQPPPPTFGWLYHGGNAQSAPTIDGGIYEAAARFNKSKIGNLVGKTIKEIHYYIATAPGTTKVKLYGPSNATTPGDLLYSADVTFATASNKWNIHALTEPITLKDEDIWLSIEFGQSGSQATVGCDPGPAVIDGDWLHSSWDSVWKPFNKRTGISINWTIRLKVAL